ncbi:MAG: hypothetical protein WAX38_00985, partial [Minisyncoccia bacterium]
MKKYILIFVLFTSSISPLISHAQACSNDVTVVYVNGMFAESEDYVVRDKDLIKDKYEIYYNPKGMTFNYGYNPSRFSGIADSWKVIMQSYMPDNYVRDHDFHTIVNKLHKEVSTKRILLVGHSQGTFYTNLLYQYYIENGVPPQSISVFNIATPASFVAGNGTYVTSASDNVINSARETQYNYGAPAALSANTNIGSMPGDDASGLFFGHNLRTVYLPALPKVIATEINEHAQKLQAASTDYYPCLPANNKPLTYIGQQSGLVVASGLYIAAYGSAKTIDIGAKVIYAIATTTLDMTTYAGTRAADQLIALGNATIQATNTLASVFYTPTTLASVATTTQVRPPTLLDIPVTPTITSPLEETLSTLGVEVYPKKITQNKLRVVAPIIEPSAPRIVTPITPLPTPPQSPGIVLGASIDTTVPITPQPFTLSGGAGQGGGGGAPA